MPDRTAEIFEEALSRPPDERAAMLAASCAGDATLQARVERLLKAHEQAGSFLDSPTSPQPPAADPAGEGPGTVIGRYRLLQLIGEGGFGRVFMAEQRQPVVRTVAVKIIKWGMDTREVVARFEAERQALAMMSHEGIATVLDGGATESGRPYFVMELVKGSPITAYCDRTKAPIAERLDLFCRVCAAVQHAHQKGVIHRDLKPSNVLVAHRDGRAVPKVIDFGIAKAAGTRLTDKTFFTEFRQFIGTPEYMSPEQAGGGGTDIDTRSDIYSLGVLLYELLTGTTPLDREALRNASVGEMQRMICEGQTPRPSTRLSTLQSLGDVAERRQTEPRRLGLLVRGDLDWIVLKALEKDRGRRYESASALADDVRRFLADEPVSASPPSAAYRARKFVRRHRGAVAAGSAVAMALLLGGGAALAGYVSALKARDDAIEAGIAQRQAAQRAGEAQAAAEQSERAALASADKATQEAAKANAINDFFQNLLQGADPDEAGANRDVTVRELVDRSARGIDEGRLTDKPAVEAYVRGTIGGVYRSLGDDAAAERHLLRAVALGEQGALSRHDLACMKGELGHIARGRDDLDAAEREYRGALDLFLLDGVEEAPANVAATYNNLAGIAIARDRLDEADGLYEKAAELLRQSDARQSLQLTCNRAFLAQRRGDRPTAERMIRQALAEAQDRLGPDDPFLVQNGVNLGVIVAQQGRFPEATEILTRAIDLAHVIFGDRHPETLRALRQTGNMFMFQGDWARAESTLARVVNLRAELGSEDRGGTVAECMNSYCVVLERQQRPAEAEPLRRELLDAARAGPPADLANALASLGRNLLDQRRWEEAQPPLRECLSMRRDLFPPGHPEEWLVALSAGTLGAAIVGSADEAAAHDTSRALALFAEAEPLIISAAGSLPGDARVPPPRPWSPDRGREALERAALLYTSWERVSADPAHAAKAAEWTARVQEHDAVARGGGG